MDADVMFLQGQPKLLSRDAPIWFLLDEETRAEFFDPVF
jgi:hypothetical protein